MTSKLEELIIKDAERVVSELLTTLEVYRGVIGYGISDATYDEAQELLGNIDRWFIDRGGRDSHKSRGDDGDGSSKESVRVLRRRLGTFLEDEWN